MILDYKEADGPIPNRSIPNNEKIEQVFNEEFNDFEQNLIDFYNSHQDFEKELNDEIVKQSTFILEQMINFFQEEYDFSMIISPLHYIFQLINLIFENKYFELEDKHMVDPELINFDQNEVNFLDLQSFLLSFVNFIKKFTKKSSDQRCYDFISTGYINILILILNNVQSSIILFPTIKCFINLLNQKPLVGQCIPYQLYNDLHNLYSSLNIQRRHKIYFDAKFDINSQENSFVCNLIEACCNFEIFLPDQYFQAISSFQKSNSSQICAMLNRIVTYDLQRKDPFIQLKNDFFFKMIEKIFRYTNSFVEKNYSSLSFINFLNKFFRPEFNFRYDKQIMYCFLRIAELGATQASFILTPEFCQYVPYRINNQEDDYIDVDLILSYCNLWTTIITMLNRPTRFERANIRGMKLLRNNSDSIIEMTRNILDQQKDGYEFELIKATTTIHIAIINSKDNELISKLLINLPDVIDRIQQLLEEADPENAVLIANAIEILFNFANREDGSNFQNLIDWLQNGDLIESLEDTYSRLADEDIFCEEIQRVIEILNPTNLSKE